MIIVTRSSHPVLCRAVLEDEIARDRSAACAARVEMLTLLIFELNCCNIILVENHLLVYSDLRFSVNVV